MQFSFDVPAYWPDLSYPAHDLYRDLVESARAAEQIGFTAITIPEHHFINYFAMPAPLVLATHLAAVTTSARIVVAVIVLPFHDIRVLAGEICVVDHLSDGRLELGFGRGGAKYEFTRMGLSPDDAREMFDEKFEALLKLLQEKNVAINGKFVKVPELTIMPRPFQTPLPPLWIAAMRPESAYHLGKRGINVQSTTLREPVSKAREVIKGFHRGASEYTAGKKPRISFFRWVFVTESDAETQEVLHLGLENEERFHNLLVTDGTVHGGEVQRVKTSHTIDSVRDVAIVGSAQECVDKLKEYEELNVDDLNVRMNFGASHTMVMRSLDRFQNSVLPHFRKS
jgi:alkanesulfonate monooxygenase SsuD/methylene tetrahydromethanopterin reductase-like flavin-dependent oxidoreductase (luciferase family)